MYPRLAHFGPITLSTYGVLAAAGLVLSVLFAERCAARAGISPEKMYTLCLATALGTVVLSRLVLVLQAPQSFRAYPLLVLSLPTVTRFGLLLATFSVFAALFALRLPLLHTLDALSPAALLFATFLHLGSFFAGTDLGSRTTLAIGNIVRGDEGHHPVALYAACLTAASAAIVTAVLQKQNRAGFAFGGALALAATGRFVADEFRPAYLMPQTAVPGFLRIDQIVLVLLTVAGMLFFFDWRRSHA